MSSKESEKVIEDVERTPPSEINEILDLDRLGEKEGYILDAQTFKASHATRDLKLAKDGKTILIPQPSDDPNDPLNWPQSKKMFFLFIIASCAFLPDYGSATGAVTLLEQAKIWGMTPDEVNHSQAGNVFMLGAGGIFVTIMSAYFGRLPVLFYFMVTAVWTAAWCAGAHGFNDFMAARILNGFFSTVAQAGGLMFIKDLFFFHEHARKINIWASFVILSPYFGPLLAAFMLTKLKWQWPFGIYTIETGLCLIAVILFMDETYYNRRIPIDQQPERKSRLMRMLGIEQWKSRHQRSTFSQAVMRLAKVATRPTVVISWFYYMITFAWVVGVNTTLSIFLVSLYNFGPKQIGFFYFTPIVSAILGEIIGHWLHDFVANMYMKSHGGRFEPEARLRTLWVSTPFVIAGLTLMGFCLERGYHFMWTSFAWGLYVFGIMITTVAVSAYNLDSYPEGSGEVAVLINCSRTTGGFIISYFQVRWATADGTIHSFGTQAGLCGVAFLIVLFLQAFGKRIRQWAGPLDFKTD